MKQQAYNKKISVVLVRDVVALIITLTLMRTLFSSDSKAYDNSNETAKNIYYKTQVAFSFYKEYEKSNLKIPIKLHQNQTFDALLISNGTLISLYALPKPFFHTNTNADTTDNIPIYLNSPLRSIALNKTSSRLLNVVSWTVAKKSIRIASLYENASLQVHQYSLKTNETILIWYKKNLQTDIDQTMTNLIYDAFHDSLILSISSVKSKKPILFSFHSNSGKEIWNTNNEKNKLEQIFIPDQFQNLSQTMSDIDCFQRYSPSMLLPKRTSTPSVFDLASKHRQRPFFTAKILHASHDNVIALNNFNSTDKKLTLFSIKTGHELCYLNLDQNFSRYIHHNGILETIQFNDNCTTSAHDFLHTENLFESNEILCPSTKYKLYHHYDSHSHNHFEVKKQPSTTLFLSNLQEMLVSSSNNTILTKFNTLSGEIQWQHLMKYKHEFTFPSHHSHSSHDSNSESQLNNEFHQLHPSVSKRGGRRYPPILWIGHDKFVIISNLNGFILHSEKFPQEIQSKTLYTIKEHVHHESLYLLLVTSFDGIWSYTIQVQVKSHYASIKDFHFLAKFFTSFSIIALLSYSWRFKLTHKLTERGTDA